MLGGLRDREGGATSLLIDAQEVLPASPRALLAVVPLRVSRIVRPHLVKLHVLQPLRLAREAHAPSPEARVYVGQEDGSPLQDTLRVMVLQPSPLEPPVLGIRRDEIIPAVVDVVPAAAAPVLYGLPPQQRAHA